MSLKINNIYLHIYADSAQGGDIKKYNGSSGESIYGKYFDDENFLLKVFFNKNYVDA